MVSTTSKHVPHPGFHCPVAKMVVNIYRQYFTAIVGLLCCFVSFVTLSSQLSSEEITRENKFLVKIISAKLKGTRLTHHHDFSPLDDKEPSTTPTRDPPPDDKLTGESDMDNTEPCHSLTPDDSTLEHL